MRKIFDKEQFQKQIEQSAVPTPESSDPEKSRKQGIIAAIVIAVIIVVIIAKGL